MLSYVAKVLVEDAEESDDSSSSSEEEFCNDSSTSDEIVSSNLALEYQREPYPGRVVFGGRSRKVKLYD